MIELVVVAAAVAAGLHLLKKDRKMLHSPLPNPPLFVSSHYGPRTHPTTGQINSQHTGIDLPAPEGTPIFAVEAGVVLRVDAVGTPKGAINGNAVHIRTSTGRIWSYLHMVRPSAVTVGQEIAAGQEIGQVGNTGRSRGNHLHLQVGDTAWRSFNPIPLFPRGTFKGV